MNHEAAKNLKRMITANVPIEMIHQISRGTNQQCPQMDRDIRGERLNHVPVNLSGTSRETIPTWRSSRLGGY